MAITKKMSVNEKYSHLPNIFYYKVKPLKFNFLFVHANDEK